MWGLLAATGLVSDGAQPKMGVAWPLKNLEKLEEADDLSEEHFAQCLAEIQDQSWSIVENVKDPEAAQGGDIKFWTKPAVGRYQYCKVTMTMRNTTTDALIDLALSEELDTRKEFSADVQKVDVLAKTEKTSLQHLIYGTPPGVANREFVVLASQREVSEDVVMAFGCSVDTPKVPEQSVPVRGATQFCWHLTQVGEHVLVNWFNVFDPRGWTPAFLLAWMKSAAVNEFVNIRNVLAGKKVELKKTELSDIGMSEEDIKKAQEESAKQQK